METYSRPQFKHEPTLQKLLAIIVQNHKVAGHTEKNLCGYPPDSDICEETRHFSVIPPTVFIHYDTSTWRTSKGFVVKVESIGIYNDAIEYEVARSRQLNGSRTRNNPSLN